MTKNRILISIILIFLYGNISAQMLEGYESSTIHIEAKKGTIKSDGTGYFFGFTSAKDKTPYSAIVIEKEVLKGSENIRLTFKKEKLKETDKSEIYVLTIPNNKNFVYSSPDTENKLTLIHMGKIYSELAKKGVSTSEVYLLPNYIDMLQIPISKKDLFQLKESWEKTK